MSTSRLYTIGGHTAICWACAHNAPIPEDVTEVRGSWTPYADDDGVVFCDVCSTRLATRLAVTYH